MPYCVRNGGAGLDALQPGADLDVLVERRHRHRAHLALQQAGFHRLSAPGHRGHRFYVAVDSDGFWRKVDVISRLRYGTESLPVQPVIQRRQRRDGVWSASETDEAAHRARRQAGLREPSTGWSRVVRRLPTGPRRRGTVVAVLGPDGAGKGSVLDAVQDLLPVGVTRVYLGNRPRPGVAAIRERAPRRKPGPLRETAFLVRKAVWSWREVLRAQSAAWRGHVVLCDRHPSEVLAVQPDRTVHGAALERFLFATLVPAPDRVIVLDAPGEVLFSRKGEHDPVTLERWRQGYLSTFVPPGIVVDTSGPLPDSVRAVLAVLWQELARRRRWRTSVACVDASDPAGQ